LIQEGYGQPFDLVTYGGTGMAKILILPKDTCTVAKGLDMMWYAFIVCLGVGLGVGVE
jgi:hypothetical protein